MIADVVKQMKADAPALAGTSGEQRNEALLCAARNLKANAEKIFEANRKDVAQAVEAGVREQVVKRLIFNEKKLADVCEGMRQLAALQDPLGKVLLRRELDEHLVLKRITVPIGVIGVIFEARPDALVQISALCLKSGNCAILKGGRETASTGRVLYEMIYESFLSAGMPAGCLKLAQSHSEIDELLGCDEDVDLLIPRGSNAFVRYIMDHTRIPVMGHADGVCHVFVDEAADQEMAVHVIRDAKIQYPVACNAAEMVLVHRNIAAAFLPKLKAAMDECGVTLRPDQECAGILDMPTVLTEEEYHREYGDLILGVCMVDDVNGAAAHINRYGSHHTDSIITRSDEAARIFMEMVDSAGVYRNVSTRFADGFRYGFGAEVGISTSKLHARGPVGLEGLVTYKYLLEGSGQIVDDYASGRKNFHFRDL